MSPDTGVAILVKAIKETKANGKDVKYDQERTAYGWRLDAVLDAQTGEQPTTYRVKRPS
nr:hypothetical protein [Burkholderia pseudomallei]